MSDLAPLILQLAGEIRELRRQLLSTTRPEAAARVSVAEAGALLGCSRDKVFELLKAGKLKRAKKFGRSAQITYASIQAVLEGVSEPARAPKARRPKTDAQEKQQLAEFIAGLKASAP